MAFSRILGMKLFRSLGKPLGQAGLFAVCGVLMNNALRSGSVHRALRRAEQLDVGLVRRSGGFEFLDLGLHRGLDHPVAQVFLFVHLHALDGRLDIRQILHLPTQIANHIIALVNGKCKSFIVFSCKSWVN